MHCFAFDIETVPDTALGRRLYGLEDLTEEQVANVMFSVRRQQTGAEFLPLHQQRVVAIAVAMRSGDVFKVWSLGERDAGEAELIRRFFDGLEKFSPDLVSWNGASFDLPVLHYRALLHGIQAPRYWETGDEDQAFRWNNYLSRYHWRHLDLMDVLSGFQHRGRASLEQVAVMLGLPGKLGMSGDKVWDYFLRGDIDEIRAYCETDALNTYLIYLRFELMRGRLSREAYASECEKVRAALASAEEAHFLAFLEAWASPGSDDSQL